MLAAAVRSSTNITAINLLQPAYQPYSNQLHSDRDDLMRMLVFGEWNSLWALCKPVFIAVKRSTLNFLIGVVLYAC